MPPRRAANVFDVVWRGTGARRYGGIDARWQHQIAYSTVEAHHFRTVLNKVPRTPERTQLAQAGWPGVFSRAMPKKLPPAPSNELDAWFEWLSERCTLHIDKHWQSMPTVMCCHSSGGGLDLQTAQTVFTCLLFALAFLPGSAKRLRGGRVTVLHAAVIAWVLVIDPCVCALRTYARYGTGLRQPWQGGLRQLVVLASIHVSTDIRLPKAVYFAILGLRCTAPLFTRILEDVIQFRVLLASPAWDAVHGVLVFSCMAHYVKVQRWRVQHVPTRMKAEQEYKEKTL